MVDYIDTPTMGDILSEGLFSAAEMAWLKIRACQEKCVNGYSHISRLEPVCQIV